MAGELLNKCICQPEFVKGVLVVGAPPSTSSG